MSNLEAIESELAELARLATMSESFDEDRAQYLLDLQSEILEQKELIPERIKQQKRPNIPPPRQNTLKSMNLVLANHYRNTPGARRARLGFGPCLFGDPSRLQ